MNKNSYRYFRRKRIQAERTICNRIKKLTPQTGDILLLTLDQRSAAARRQTHEQLYRCLKTFVPKGVGLLTIPSDCDLTVMDQEALSRLGLRRITSDENQTPN
jgi:hypothetical protein